MSSSNETGYEGFAQLMRENNININLESTTDVELKTIFVQLYEQDKISEGFYNKVTMLFEETESDKKTLPYL